MSEYNMPPIGLFGKRCRIKHVSDLENGFVYRIVNSGVRSNSWKELPLGRYGDEAILHDTMEDVVYVVCDTLIDEMSKIEKVALKDIKIMPDETAPIDRIEYTEEETNMTIEYLKDMQEGYIEGEGYERHPLPEWYALNYAIEILEQSRTGHWIDKDEESKTAVCSCCNRNNLLYGNNCKWRGAKMVEPQKGEG